MANPQLLSYIKQQLGSGDTESSIKNNLRSVGWAEGDIADAFKEASPAPAAAPIISKPTSPAAPSFTPQTTQPMANLPAQAGPSPAAPSMPKVAPAEPRKINLEAFAPMSSPSPMSRPFSASPAVVSFTAQKPMENIFQPKSMASNPAVPGMNPSSMSVSPMATMSPAAPKKSWASIVTMIVMVLIIAGLGWFSWMLYTSNAGLKTQINTITTQLSSLTGEQTTNSQTLANQIAALQDENQDLGSQLALFLPRSAASTSTLALKGIIGGGGKNNFTLTTSKGIVVSVKNSKDAKIIATLTPLLGLSTAIAGIPTAGAREITVTLVNGFEPSVPTPPPAAATTTPPAATSTTP